MIKLQAEKQAKVTFSQAKQERSIKNIMGDDIEVRDNRVWTIQKDSLNFWVEKQN